MTTRKTSVDSAIGTFKTGAIALYGEKRTEALAAIGTFETAVNASLSKARASCASGADPKIVRDTFEADMKTSLTNLKTTRETIKKTSQTELTKLQEAKKESIETAIRTFQTNFETKKATFKEFTVTR